MFHTGVHRFTQVFRAKQPKLPFADQLDFEIRLRDLQDHARFWNRMTPEERLKAHALLHESNEKLSSRKVW